MDGPPLLKALHASAHIDEFLPTRRQFLDAEVLQAEISSGRSFVYVSGQDIGTWLRLHQQNNQDWLEFMTLEPYCGRGLMRASLSQFIAQLSQPVFCEADVANQASLKLLSQFGTYLNARTGPGYYQGKVSTRAYQVFTLGGR